MFSESKDKALWERVRTSDVYARHRKEIKSHMLIVERAHGLEYHPVLLTI